MAFVDLSRNRLVLKVLLAGPPAVGKTERLGQIGDVGRFTPFGTSVIGRSNMAVLPLKATATKRPVEIELYEWHGPERADVRAKRMFTGLDGMVYIADAREDRFVDTQKQFEFLIKEAGRSRLARLPGLLLLGMMDEGLLRLSAIASKLDGGPTWSDQLELSIDDADAFVEAIRVLGEVMLARIP